MTEDAREEFDPDPLGHARVRGSMTVGDLADAYGEAGMGAAALADAVDVTAEMFAREDTTVLLGLAGAMVPGGQRAVVADLIADGYVDALVTTGANLTHDAIEAIGGHHHHGRATPEGPHAGRDGGDEGKGDATGAFAGDAAGSSPSDARRAHDERLREEGVDRIYNVYLPQEHFADLEAHLRERVFPALDGRVSIAELTRELGRQNARYNRSHDVDGRPGVAAAAAEANVPVYCPAVQDSVLGLQAWLYAQTSDFGLDALADMTPLSDMVHDAERTGSLLVGGGVPKNYVLQAMLVSPTAYDLAVQLTTDPEHTGGLSGATLDEARSWGKLEPDARNATVVGDATITFPLLVAAARETVES
ncbi:MAG: deoxyhypusine synthase [Halobacteriaceae archaeon]